MGRFIVKIANVGLQETTGDIIVTATYVHNEFPSRTLGAVTQSFPATANNSTITTAINSAITTELQTLDRFISAKSKIGMQYNLDVTLTNEDAIIRRNIPE